MSVAVSAVLIIVGVVGAIVLAVGIPAILGVMAYDLIKRPVTVEEEVRDTSTRIAVERGTARAFVLLGGLFWSIASFAGLYTFREEGMTAALIAAGIPLLACAVTLIVGWYFERFTAAMLVLASLAVVAWGVVYQFETGVWAVMTIALIGPMLTAAVLFWLARRDQEVFEQALSVSPQLAFVFAARSSL